jgi:hypothetical protein
MTSVVSHPKSTDIVIDASNRVADPTKPYGRPSGHIVFVVQNNDNRSHVVRIPPDEFVPHPPSGMSPGKPDPMVPLAVHWATVAANDVAVIALPVRPHAHFDPGNWTYKYTIYWADDLFGTNEQSLDPEIEINN